MGIIHNSASAFYFGMFDEGRLLKKPHLTSQNVFNFSVIFMKKQIKYSL